MFSIEESLLIEVDPFLIIAVLLPSLPEFLMTFQNLRLKTALKNIGCPICKTPTILYISQTVINFYDL